MHTRTGTFRLGAVGGVLFAFAFQACWNDYREARDFYEERLADYEAMLANPNRLEAEFWDRLNTLRTYGVDVSASPEAREQFIRDRRPSRVDIPPFWPLVTLVLGGGLLLGSLYHPQDRRRNPPESSNPYVDVWGGEGRRPQPEDLDVISR